MFDIGHVAKMAVKKKTCNKSSKKSASRKGTATSSYSKTKSNKKSRRFRPGTKALREIRKFQKTTELLLAKSPFRRLVREICVELNSAKKWQARALTALQVKL